MNSTWSPTETPSSLSADLEMSGHPSPPVGGGGGVVMNSLESAKKDWAVPVPIHDVPNLITAGASGVPLSSVVS